MEAALRKGGAEALGEYFLALGALSPALAAAVDAERGGGAGWEAAVGSEAWLAALMAATPPCVF